MAAPEAGIRPDGKFLVVVRSHFIARKRQIVILREMKALGTDHADFGFLHCIDEESDFEEICAMPPIPKPSVPIISVPCGSFLYSVIARSP